MKPDGSVSVIIPAYNAADSLARCLDSVFQQDHGPIQVVVIDDGSTDDTWSVAKSYGRAVQVIKERNSGQGAARNAGLSEAWGDFIAFLDADDYWTPGFLKACVGFLLSHQEVMAVSTAILVRMLDGSELPHPAQLCEDGGSNGEPFVIENFFEFWARFDHIRTGSNVIRHSAIREAGPQRADLRISQDLEYWGYLATFGRWGFIPKPLWVGNSRQAARTRGWSQKYAIRRRLCPEVEQWGTRIEPRLKPCEWKGYEVVRGRVAMNYAQSKILAGAHDSAYRLVKKYGSAMPMCAMRHIMVGGASLGGPAWLTACGLVRWRERIKVLRLRLSGRSRM